MSSKSNLTLGGCTYYPAVMYLDFVDFGVRSPGGYFPRLNMWKKDMIKEFARYDLKQGHEYGRRNTCYGLYAHDGASTSGACSVFDSLEAYFKDALHVDDIAMMVDMFTSSTEPLTL